MVSRSSESNYARSILANRTPVITTIKSQMTAPVSSFLIFPSLTTANSAATTKILGRTSNPPDIVVPPLTRAKRGVISKKLPKKSPAKATRTSSTTSSAKRAFQASLSSSLSSCFPSSSPAVWGTGFGGIGTASSGGSGWGIVEALSMPTSRGSRGRLWALVLSWLSLLRYLYCWEVRGEAFRACLVVGGDTRNEAILRGVDGMPLLIRMRMSCWGMTTTRKCRFLLR